MDGVLINSFDAWFAALNKLLKENKKKPYAKREFYLKFWRHSPGTFKVTQQCFPEKSRKEQKALDEQLNKHWRSYHSKVKMFNVKPTLKALKKKRVKMCIVSATPHKSVLHILRKKDLLKYFSFIIGEEDVKHQKPHPESINKAVRRLKLKKNECLYVGDSLADSGAARAAGVPLAMVTTTLPKAKARALSNFLITDFNQIIDLL